MRFTALFVFACAANAAQVGDFEWRGQVARGLLVEIRGINGDIHAFPSTSGDVEVTARIAPENNNEPAREVKVQLVPSDAGVTVCAIRPGQDACELVENGPGARVDYVVRLPEGVSFLGRTVNGAVEAKELRSDVEAYTVNGTVRISTTGSAQARTVNGSITASLLNPFLRKAPQFTTVNGGITLNVPAGLSTYLRAETRNGKILTDLSGLRGRVTDNTIDARIGGGRQGFPRRCKRLTEQFTFAGLYRRDKVKFAAILLATTACLYAADAPPFEWRGSVAPGRTLEIKGVNGEIRMEASTGSEVQVSARITARRSDPNSVRVEVVPKPGGDVSICSVYSTEDGPVGCSGRGNIRDNDTRVAFTVRVPRGVNLVARNVNGDVVGRGLQNAIEARTVNGRVEIATSETASGHTVNGEIVADFGQVGQASDFATVNGSITVGLPPTANANVQASVVNGSINPDFPLTLTGSFSAKKINGRLNNGGPSLSLKTVNGSIHIKRSGSVI